MCRNKTSERDDRFGRLASHSKGPTSECGSVIQATDAFEGESGHGPSAEGIRHSAHQIYNPTLEHSLIEKGASGTRADVYLPPSDELAHLSIQDSQIQDSASAGGGSPSAQKHRPCARENPSPSQSEIASPARTESFPSATRPARGSEREAPLHIESTHLAAGASVSEGSRGGENDSKDLVASAARCGLYGVVRAQRYIVVWQSFQACVSLSQKGW